MPVRVADPAGWAELEKVVADLHAHGELDQWMAGLSGDPPLLHLVERWQASMGAGWRATPATMAAHLSGGEFQLWPYVELLGRKFAEAADGTSLRQIWLLPSRYGKSTVASQWGPTWLLDRNPGARIILTAYADGLALEFARNVRDLITDNAEHLAVRLRRDRRRADRFVTPEGGGILARGLRSGIAGFGAGRGGGIIIDDPFKNWQDAHSPTVRLEVWNAYRSVIRLRLDDDAAFVICVQTRWHEQDLAGQLIEAAKEGTHWDVVRLPALAEAYDPDSLDPLLRLPDPLGRAPGEPLEPRRFSLAEVQARAVDLGAYLGAALEQQRPAPEEGGELKRAWWKWHDELPVAFDTSCSSWDLKLKEADSGDFVAGQAWGRIGSDYWLRGTLRGRWNIPTVRAALALMAVRFPDVNRHYVENTGNGPEVMRELRSGIRDYVLSDEICGALGITKDERPKVQALLRRGVPGILPVNPKGSKVARVRAITGRVEAGNVHLIEGHAGAVTLVNEAAAFPNAEHDDTVDAMTQALVKLGNISLGGTRSTRRRMVPAPASKPSSPATPGVRRRRVRRRILP